MLGKIARQAQPKAVEISTALTDALMESWTEQRDVIAPTLGPLEEEWREFWLYASSAHKWCPRMYALMTANADKLVGEIIKPDTMWLFEQGHVYHDVLQQKALMSLPKECFLGSWMRLVPDVEATKRAGHLVMDREVAEGKQPFSESDIIRGWQVRPEGDDWQYVESKIRMHDIRVVVKLDGILALPDQPKEVLEIKTESLSALDSLNPRVGGVPRPQHILQCQIGMMGTGLDRARILYVFKGARKPTDAFIEHVVERDEGAIRKIRKLASECVAAVTATEAAMESGLEGDDLNARIDEEYPRFEDCPMKSKGKARYCGGRDLCFPKKKKKK